MISLIIRGCSSCLGKWKFIDINTQYFMIFIFIHACNKISAYVINIQAKASNFIPAVREAIAKECQRHMQESFGAFTKQNFVWASAVDKGKGSFSK